MRRHAEIVGGGIAGLSFAILLAQRGWSARVHERSPVIHEVGAGIYLRNNAVEVLEAIGVFCRLKPRGVQLEYSQHLDRDGRLMRRHACVGHSRVHVFLRQDVVDALRDAAQEAGVEIVVGSMAVAADPVGELLLEDGRRLRADLVIAADGARSRIRESLNINATHRSLPTIVNRYLVPSREINLGQVSQEHWSDRYRIGIAPCGNDLTYVYQVCPEWDTDAAALPSNGAHWSRAFPRLRREIEILSRTSAIRHNYVIVRCPLWQRGRVAIIGDAAHALPQALGQGAGLTLMNAQALAIVLGRGRAVEEALPAWEAAVRFVSDRTQRWALRYDFFTREWPAQLRFMRPAISRVLQSFRPLNRRMRIADRGLKLAPEFVQHVEQTEFTHFSGSSV